MNQIDRDTKYLARKFSGKWSVAFIFTSGFFLPLVAHLILRLRSLPLQISRIRFFIFRISNRFRNSFCGMDFRFFDVYDWAN